MLKTQYDSYKTHPKKFDYFLNEASNNENFKNE